MAQTKDQTPLLPLSGTRKVVRTPTNPFEVTGTVEVFVAKKIIARRIQHIFAGSNKGRKADHYLVVWEVYPLKKDYTWEPIENLYGHEDLAQTYEQWLKTENERLDSQEAERKTERQSTAQKIQDAAADKFRKHDKMTKKTKGTNSTGKETLEVEDDEAEAAADAGAGAGAGDAGDDEDEDGGGFFVSHFVDDDAARTESEREEEEDDGEEKVGAAGRSSGDADASEADRGGCGSRAEAGRVCGAREASHSNTHAVCARHARLCFGVSGHRAAAPVLAVL